MCNGNEKPKPLLHSDLELLKVPNKLDECVELRQNTNLDMSRVRLLHLVDSFGDGVVVQRSLALVSAHTAVFVASKWQPAQRPSVLQVMTSQNTDHAA